MKRNEKRKTNQKQMLNIILVHKITLCVGCYTVSLECIISANEMENKEEQIKEDNSLNTTPFFFVPVPFSLSLTLFPMCELCSTFLLYIGFFLCEKE